MGVVGSDCRSRTVSISGRSPLEIHVGHGYDDPTSGNLRIDNLLPEVNTAHHALTQTLLPLCSQRFHRKAEAATLSALQEFGRPHF